MVGISFYFVGFLLVLRIVMVSIVVMVEWGQFESCDGGVGGGANDGHMFICIVHGSLFTSYNLVVKV